MNLRTLLAIIFLSTILACNAQKPTSNERTNDVISSGKDVNHSITLSAPEGWNTYNIDDHVNLAVVLYTDHTLILNAKNLLIYQLVNNEWERIVNETPYPDMEFIMVPSDTPAASTVSVLAVPKLLLKSGDIKLLFVISANIYDNETVGEEIKAYTEVTLKP
jgi:hypothetical protein